MIKERETLCSFAPLLAPCSPHLPRPASSTCPSCASACSAVFFLVSPCSRSPLLPHALRVPPALLRATPVPQPRAPSLARLPSHSPSHSRPCLYVCPPCLSRAVTRVCHPRALLMPLSVAPTLFPGVSPPLVFPLSPSLTPSWLPCALCGGVYLPTGLWPCPRTVMAVGFLRTMSHRILRRNTERTTVRHLSDSLRCICTVEPSRIDQPRRCCTELIQSDHSPESEPAWSQRVHTSLHLAGVPWLRRPPRPGVVNPSEQGARMSNGFNAAPSCHAESFAAM